MVRSLGCILTILAWTDAPDQSLERESNRSDSKMRARHLLSCLTDGEILILLSSQSVELVHGMLSTHFCILLPKSNWSLLLSCSPAGLGGVALSFQSLVRRSTCCYFFNIHLEVNNLPTTIIVIFPEVGNLPTRTV